MCVSFVCLFVIRFRFSFIFWFCFCLYVVNFLWILFSEKKASKQWIQFRLMFFFWFNITVLIIGPKTVSAKTKILRKIASIRILSMDRSAQTFRDDTSITNGYWSVDCTAPIVAFIARTRGTQKIQICLSRSRRLPWVLCSVFSFHCHLYVSKYRLSFIFYSLSRIILNKKSRY